MLYPTINQLTKDEFNRYELALATAKCARMITDEYVRQREAAEKSATGNKETDRNLINMINKEYRDEKAVKNAISKIHSGTYKIVRVDPNALPAEEEITEAEASELLDTAENAESASEENAETAEETVAAEESAEEEAEAETAEEKAEEETAADAE